MSEKGRASALRSQADEAYRRGVHLEALGLYTQLCRDCPGDAAWHMAAAINGMVGRCREAVDCCRQVMGLRPQAQGAYTEEPEKSGWWWPTRNFLYWGRSASADMIEGSSGFSSSALL